MENEKVEVLLHTPILLPDEDEAKKNPYLEPVLKIRGVLKQLAEAGLVLEVQECLTEKNLKLKPPYKILFLPHHKIDHFYLLN